MLHQIIKAVPLVILSSSLDVDAAVETTEGRTVGYFMTLVMMGQAALKPFSSTLPIC
jgi:DEAD/DEAH box helicase domain-containing protein